MIRALHRWPGLLAALLVLSLSGTALSVFPATERLSSPQTPAALSIGDLAERVRVAHPQVEQIRQAPSGRIAAYWFEGGRPQAAVIDPATGRGVASADPNPLERWLTNLHRSLFLGASRLDDLVDYFAGYTLRHLHTRAGRQRCFPRVLQLQKVANGEINWRRRRASNPTFSTF